MSPDPHADPLVTIPLFAKLEPQHRAALAGFLREKVVSQRQVIFWIGDEGQEFYIVRSGRVQLALPDDNGQETALAVVEAGGFFGELSLLDGGPRTATARAMTDVALLSLSRPDFLHFLRTHPEANIHVIAVVAARQREMLSKLRGIKNANEVEVVEATRWSRIADWICSMMSSQAFVITHLTIVALWVGLNLIMGKRGFDPFPFMLLAMVASLEGVLLAMFVLVSQSRQSEKDRIRADLDYQVNTKSHLEVMSLHQKVDRLTALLGEGSEPGGPAEPRKIGAGENS